MTVTTVDGLMASFLPFGIPILKAAFTPQAIGCFTSLWAVGGIPGAGANSADGVAGAVPTDATAGAFPFTNSATTYLSRYSAYSNTGGSLLLYDRLWHNSGLSITDVGAQTVNSVALDRPDALGGTAEAWWQTYTTVSTGGSLPTIVYTDQGGTGSNTGTCSLYAASSTANRCFQFVLAAGDTGVRSIQSYDNIGSHTSGTFGLIIRRYITQLIISEIHEADFNGPIVGGIPRIYDDACLELIWYSIGNAITTVGGNLALAQG